MKYKNYGSLQDVKILDSPANIRLLFKFSYLVLLRLLVKDVYTASSLSQESGISLDKVLYRLRVLTHQGLIHVVHEQPRAGRSIKHYRAVAKSFFIPQNMLGEMALSGWQEFREIRQALDHVLENAATRYDDADGLVGDLVTFETDATIQRQNGYLNENKFTLLPEIERNRRNVSYGELPLTRDAALQYHADLETALRKALTTSHNAAPSVKRENYMLVVAFAPVPES